ncbi:MAG: MBL fold metallo-hydrolase [Bacteroidota bacterium]
MFFQQLFEEKLAQYAYIIGCQKTGEAIVIDPMRDVDRYKAFAAKHNLKLVAAAETHIHADYLSGMRELASQGVQIFLSDEGDADWKYEWAIGSDYSYQLLKDGNTFHIGNIRFKAVHSPGHTPEHISYLVHDTANTEEPMGILSGDFVFVGDVGRPDLLETAAGMEGVMEDSARVLYASLDKFKDLPDYLQVWPGHGAGSACGKALGAVPDSTVGYEKRFNGSIRAAITEQDFVDFILDGQPEPPLYFARMKRDNKIGPAILGALPVPERMDVMTLKEAANTPGSVIIDTRKDRVAFMNAHLKSSLYAPMNKSFNTIAGSYIEDDQDIYLVISEDQVEEAVLDLIRIGLDRVKGFVTPDAFDEYVKNGGETERVAKVTFKEVESILDNEDSTVLDVRKATEYAEGHAPGALNMAHTRLKAGLEQLPMNTTLYVHCKSGARAAAASALLAREGFNVRYVNDLVEPWLAASAFETVVKP